MNSTLTKALEIYKEEALKHAEKALDTGISKGKEDIEQAQKTREQEEKARLVEQAEQKRLFEEKTAKEQQEILVLEEASMKLKTEIKDKQAELIDLVKPSKDKIKKTKDKIRTLQETQAEEARLQEVLQKLDSGTTLSPSVRKSQELVQEVDAIIKSLEEQESSAYCLIPAEPILQSQKEALLKGQELFNALKDKVAKSISGYSENMDTLKTKYQALRAPLKESQKAVKVAQDKITALENKKIVSDFFEDVDALTAENVIPNEYKALLQPYLNKRAVWEKGADKSALEGMQQNKNVLKTTREEVEKYKQRQVLLKRMNKEPTVTELFPKLPEEKATTMEKFKIANIMLDARNKLQEQSIRDSWAELVSETTQTRKALEDLKEEMIENDEELKSLGEAGLHQKEVEQIDRLIAKQQGAMPEILSDDFLKMFGQMQSDNQTLASERERYKVSLESTKKVLETVKEEVGKDYQEKAIVFVKRKGECDQLSGKWSSDSQTLSRLPDRQAFSKPEYASRLADAKNKAAENLSALNNIKEEHGKLMANDEQSALDKSRALVLLSERLKKLLESETDRAKSVQDIVEETEAATKQKQTHDESSKIFVQEFIDRIKQANKSPDVHKNVTHCSAVKGILEEIGLWKPYGIMCFSTEARHKNIWEQASALKEGNILTALINAKDPTCLGRLNSMLNLIDPGAGSIYNDSVARPHGFFTGLPAVRADNNPANEKQTPRLQEPKQLRSQEEPPIILDSVIDTDSKKQALQEIRMLVLSLSGEELKTKDVVKKCQIQGFIKKTSEDSFPASLFGNKLERMNLQELQALKTEGDSLFSSLTKKETQAFVPHQVSMHPKIRLSFSKQLYDIKHYSAYYQQRSDIKKKKQLDNLEQILLRIPTNNPDAVIFWSDGYEYKDVKVEEVDLASWKSNYPGLDEKPVAIDRSGIRKGCTLRCFAAEVDAFIDTIRPTESKIRPS